MITVLRTLAALSFVIACFVLALPPHGGFLDLLGVALVAWSIYMNYHMWT